MKRWFSQISLSDALSVKQPLKVIYLLFIHEWEEADMTSKIPEATLTSTEVRSFSSLRIGLRQIRLT